MPDTLSPMDRQPRTEAGRALDRHKDDLRYTSWNGLPFIVAIEDEAAALDALTAAVTLQAPPKGISEAAMAAVIEYRAAILAILRGEQPDYPPGSGPELDEFKRQGLDLTDSLVREAQVYGGDDRARQVADEQR